MTPARLTLDGEGPLYEQIRKAIARKITSHEWRPGQRIPNEADLTNSFDTSRMTVNRALSALVGDGLIVRKRKAGSFVAAPTGVQAPLTIASARTEIAGTGSTYAYELLAGNIRPVPGFLTSAGRFRPDSEAMHLRCRHLADGVPVQLEDRWIALDTVPDAAGAPFGTNPPGEWLLAYVPWTEAEHEISAVAATPVVAEDLEVPAGTPCLRIERTTWIDRAAVTFVRLTWPGSAKKLAGRFHPGE